MEKILAATPVTTRAAGRGSTDRIQGTEAPKAFDAILLSQPGTASNTSVPRTGGVISDFIAQSSGAWGFGGAEAMLARSAQRQMELLDLQMRNEEAWGEFAVVTNLLKARHDSEMSAVRNFKS